MDYTEKQLAEAAEEFQKDFEGLFLKMYELMEMSKPCPTMLPVLTYLNKQSGEKIIFFILYLRRIKQLVVDCKILSELQPLLPDHMIREEIYYLSKLREAGLDVEGLKEVSKISVSELMKEE